MTTKNNRIFTTYSTDGNEVDKLVLEEPLRTPAELWRIARQKVFSYLRIGRNSLRRVDTSIQSQYEIGNTLAELKPFGCLFSPSSAIRETWDFVIAFTLLYSCVVSPYTLAFQYSHRWNRYFLIDLLTDFIFLFNIVVKFNTGIYNSEKELINSYQAVARHYLKSWFLLDLVGALPYELFASTDQTHSINLIFRIFKLKTLKFLSKAIRLFKLFSFTGKNSHFFQGLFSMTHRAAKLATTLISIIIISHFMACLWLFAEIENTPNNWESRFGFNDLSELDLYIKALYFTLTSLCTVGYGDITAKTTGEIVIALFWMAFALYFLSFNISNLSSLISEQDYQRNLLDYKLYLVDQYVKSDNLSHSLRRKMKNEIKHMAERVKHKPGDICEVIALLSCELKYEIALSMHKGVIKEFPFFREKDTEFIGNIFTLLYCKVLDKGEIVYIQKQKATEIYFVAFGQINFVYGADLKFRAVSVGQYFGDFEIVAKCRRFFATVAQKTTHLLVMNFEVIKQFQGDFPGIWKEFEELARKRQMVNEMALAEMGVVKRLNREGKIGEISNADFKKEIEREAEMVKFRDVNQEFEDLRRNEVDEIRAKVREQREIIERLKNWISS